MTGWVQLRSKEDLTVDEVLDEAKPFLLAYGSNPDYGITICIDGETHQLTKPRRGPGRPRANGNAAKPATATKRKSLAKTTKKVAKKRRPMSPESRAKLAQNLVKARAARAAKAKAAKKTPAKRAHKVTKQR